MFAKWKWFAKNEWNCNFKYTLSCFRHSYPFWFVAVKVNVAIVVGVVVGDKITVYPRGTGNFETAWLVCSQKN